MRVSSSRQARIPARPRWVRPSSATTASAVKHATSMSVSSCRRRSGDPLLSEAVREAVLRSVTAGSPRPGSRAQSAVTLRAALDDDGSGLTAGETALLGELLDRLGRAQEVS
ncbi:hypothetical protein ACWKSP_04600 [Micromonosporaceae bacterium Da 78-11]